MRSEGQIALRTGLQTMTVRGALKEAMARLRDARVPSHTLAAELLLMHATGRDRAWLYAHPEETVEPATAERFLEMVARRSSGVPTQYLTGKQEFWGLEFEVTPEVLIPRPETEHVVEVALDRLGLRGARSGCSADTEGSGLVAADVGTGSGCIAVALAKQLPGACFYATDISSAALEVALRNATRHGVAGQIEFINCNLLDGLTREPRRLDLIVSNPPYIGSSEQPVLQREVRDHEPESALYAGEHGNDLYEPLIGQAAQLLKPEGILVLELGHNSLPAVRPLLENAMWKNAGVTNDLAGIPRVLAAERTLAESRHA
ncbi:MAG TPA: peptide chain release factor N(5)-glutamine methyltransferase [Candidatus Acidoferrales bacterium]|nr:peptide chain release factor N(5)-glutamine methyltransferase [Candidatus Acidoferrales bacterium]